MRGEDNAHQPQNRETRDFNQDVEYEYGEGDHESSVISEIVDEQIIEIGSDDEPQDIQNNDNRGSSGINNYLENIKREDYVNHEYENRDHNENSPYNEDYQRQHYSNHNDNNDYVDYNQDEELQKQMNYRKIYENKMMDNSPIVENPIEEEMTASPQYYEAPRAINPKLRKKYEGVNLSDKSHLVWEQERIQRKRIQRQMREANVWAKPYSYREIDWNPEKNPKQAYFNYEKVPNKSSMWYFAHSSSVPMLTPSQSSSTQFSKTSGAMPNRLKYDPNESASKRGNYTSNLKARVNIRSYAFFLFKILLEQQI